MIYVYRFKFAKPIIRGSQTLSPNFS